MLQAGGHFAAVTVRARRATVELDESLVQVRTGLYQRASAARVC